MKRLVFFALMYFLSANGNSQEQESVSKPISCMTIDDKTNGHVLFSYKIPSDGFYTFSVTGGMLPKRACTIYYYEYLFQLVSLNRQYSQPSYNIASQAQDGDICHFETNEKINSIGGIFSKDEVVEMRLIILKSEVNGKPGNVLRLTKKTMVQVEKNKSLAVGN